MPVFFFKLPLYAKYLMKVFDSIPVNSFAEEFYETIACDQRIDAEYNLKSKEEREKRIK
jgi:hypothetical protein